MRIWYGFLFVILIALLSAAGMRLAGNAGKTAPAPAPITAMRIQSDFTDGGPVPVSHTCDGEGKDHPPLAIKNVPPESKTLVLVFDDPDAPIGVFTHWVLWNIAPATSVIAEGETPAGAVVGTNSAGRQTYVPPCPPFGKHRYVFHLYALDTPLSVPPSAKVSDIMSAMGGHVLAKAELTGTYQRK